MRADKGSRRACPSVGWSLVQGVPCRSQAAGEGARSVRIENRTRWNTAHLRAFAQHVAASTLEASQRKKLVVTFINSRTRGESGHAYYGLVYTRRLGIHF